MTIYGHKSWLPKRAGDIVLSLSQACATVRASEQAEAAAAVALTIEDSKAATQR